MSYSISGLTLTFVDPEDYWQLHFVSVRCLHRRSLLSGLNLADRGMI